MLCEECNEREAVYTVSVLIGDESTTRHLCGECMSRMNATMNPANIRNLLSSILSAITGKAEEQQAPGEDIECPRCHTALSRFTKTGRLGCPGCYDAFRDQLGKTLLQIHGRVQHAGRRPLGTVDEQRVRTRREQLSRLMAQAVAL